MEEIWKQHPKIDENYEFSNYGNFRKSDTKFELKKTKDTSKETCYYVTFLKLRNSLERKRFKLHRIIAELFVFNDDVENKIIVKHIDSNRLNNLSTNLVWVTETESVSIDIIRSSREFGKLSQEEIIKIREEFEQTEINIYDMAVNLNITPASISNILRYKTYATIQPEKKYSYRINILIGEEYADFFKVKLSEKTAIVNLKKTKKYREEYVTKNKKPSKKSISKFLIPKEKFQPIYNDFINSGMENFELFEKHNIKIGHLNHNKLLYETPQLIILENEEFIIFNKKVFVSNLGRFINHDKSRIVKYNIKTTNVAKNIARTIAKYFLGLQNHEQIEYIDGDPYNIKLSNLKIKKQITIDKEIIEKIKYEYINTKITQTELATKYKQSLSIINKFLKGSEKRKLCFICGTDDPEDFLCYNAKKRCDSCTDNNPKVYKNLTKEERKEKIKISSDWSKYNPLRTKLLGARARARTKGIEFDLDEEFIIDLHQKQSGKCFYSGIPISIDFTEEINVFSIDRINSKLGYVKDNVCLTNKFINVMKLNLTLDEFFYYIKAIYEHSNLNVTLEQSYGAFEI